jgi:hypothetical protein
VLTDFIDYCVEEKTLGDEDRKLCYLTLFPWLKQLARIHAMRLQNMHLDGSALTALRL